MLGTNRKGTTLRLNDLGTAYVPYLSEPFQCRYEPKKYTKYSMLKEKQITFSYQSDLMDIKVSDRIIDKDRQFVACWVSRFTEILGKHLEILMREIGPTVVHEKVIRRSLDIVQSGYDPLLHERNAESKEYNEEEMLVLMDPWEIGRAEIIKMLDAGKIEELDYVMTVDLPSKIVKEDRIVYRWIEYEIKWIIPQIYQYSVGLKKSMVNYIANQQ